MNDAAERLSCAEARNRFDDLLDRMVKQKDRVLLMRRGKPVAALVPIDDLEFLEAIEDGLEAAAIPWEKINAACEYGCVT